VEALEEEQKHLDETGAAYDLAFAALVGRKRSQGIDDFANEALEQMRRERIRVYTEASGPLYFGRIDGTDGETLYVGRHAVWSPDNELLSVNWRAPAAEPFYAATAHEPRGVRLRRRLDIEDRTVLGFVDETLTQEGDDHLADAIVEDITRRRVGEMRQIISTITPDQYELISRETEGALVIQGGPGTGKTAVGLHRAAWLLYADPALTRAGVLVVGPNETFIRYIEQVLPALGEGGVEQRPIGALISRAHGDATESRELAALKGSARMAVLLHRLLWERLAVPDEDQSVELGRGRVTLTRDELRELVTDCRERTRSYQGARERFRERLAGLIAARATDGGRATFADHDELLSAVRKTRDYQRLATRIWPRETADGLYARLFKNRKRLSAAAGDLLSPEEITALAGAPRPEGRRDMTPTDVALLDEAHWLVDPDFRRYGHVVIDEAQNLTPMELRMAARRARGQSLTILGDLAQRTAEAGVLAWDAVLAEAGVTRHMVRELDISYRVPDEFLALAAPLVPSASSVPRGIRTAPWPPRAVAADIAGVAEVVVEQAERLAREVGSVGVIAPTALVPAMRDALEPAGFADATRGPLGPAITLLDPHVAKGLEFDAALVVEPAAILAERPDGGPGGLYTALTRSTRALVIVHAEPLPAALADEPALARSP